MGAIPARIAVPRIVRKDEEHPLPPDDVRDALLGSTGGVTGELLLSLTGLALVDSLSVGTLLIPLFFLVAPRLREGRLLLYLATIAGFYLVVGVVLLLGAGVAVTALGDALDSTAGYGIQLALGVGLLLGSFLIPTKPRESLDGRPGRLTRWRERALEGPRATGLVVVALAAGVLEVATMLPYLGAVGLLTAAPVEPLARVAILVGYCAVMVLPALVLLVVRVVARALVEAPLARLAAWLERSSGETTAWIVGIVGFLLARDAAFRLGLFDALGRLGDVLPGG